MKIAVLSGKGGTGKTLISTNLASFLANSRKVQLLDCDVEEPNSHIFFKTEFTHWENVNIMIPLVDQNQCSKCGICARECKFGAIVSYPTGTLVFQNLCHGCGVCSMVCPEKAISEVPKMIGEIKKGSVNPNLALGMGLLKIGEPSGVQIIRQLKSHIDPAADVVILDSPPGSSCPVVETLRQTDFALIVTESSPFGLHDMQAVLEIVEEMKIPHGVIINRYDASYREMENFLREKNIPLLLTIPFDRSIAESYSRGKLFSIENPAKASLMEQLFAKISEVLA